MLSNEHEARASQGEVADVGQDEMREVTGGVMLPFYISWDFPDYPWTKAEARLRTTGVMPP